MTTFKKGDIVLYRPVLALDPFGAVIQSEASPATDCNLRCEIVGLGPGYFNTFGLHHQPSHITSVLADRLELAPTIFCSDGKWRTGIDVAEHSSEFRAFRLLGVICWNSEASEFRNIGWEHSLGDGYCKCAESYEAARAAVEEACK